MVDAFAVPLRRTFSTEAELCAFAARFALQLKPGDIVALAGPLGSGKTTFVRAIVEALHKVDQSSSPTFTFWHRYPGEPPIEHIDLFRINDPRESQELGLEEAFSDRAIALVEWWRNAPDLIPRRGYEIDIDGAGEEPRTIIIRERT